MTPHGLRQSLNIVAGNGRMRRKLSESLESIYKHAQGDSHFKAPYR